MISVIIPTYREPEVLDLCLRSIVNGQRNSNEIIVVVDGYYEENEETLLKYKDHIIILKLDDNVGLATATNYGVYCATNEYVLIANDDNVFCDEWDNRLKDDLKVVDSGAILSINQIEPYESIFKQFVIKDLGKTVKDFNLDQFNKFEFETSYDLIDKNGSTLPIVMRKKDYMRIGGWDVDYPSATVVDWDFFYKCQLNDIPLYRTYNVHFYHFVSIGTNKDPEVRKNEEINGHNYSKFKWGNYFKMDRNTNLKTLI